MATPGTAQPTSVGGMDTFNIAHGFVESLVRGMRNSFLSDSDYHHLTQCDNLDDCKMNLGETDFGPALQEESTLSPTILQSAAINKLSTEFLYLRSQSVAPLSTFLDFITHEYMIDNIMLLLKGTMSGRDINDLISMAHPLGLFKESTMRSIPTFESNSKGYADLYQCVLVDTPVGVYFAKFLKETSQQLGNAGEVRNVLEEVEIEIIKASLQKFWLEDFYAFCEELGGETAMMMGEILRTRADTHAINVTLNSFGTALNEPSMRLSDRKRLYPSFGHLYPHGTAMLVNAHDPDSLGAVVSQFSQYAPAWTVHTSGVDKSIDDAFYERDVHQLELAFEGQMHFACFYAYVKLKEQEIRNLVWISECVLQNQKESINSFVPIFSQHSPWRVKNQRR
ncbi:hypothetical protein TrVE_jg11630 [Triparma verrucosa]|uniref:V-type proton ATPase subunit n=2 Tax=Triparma TaxID=722752 RepID=A0A9W7DS17_9STRA|nr:hypothetical protein TrST_g5760 [Triparma strigata]GMH82796.1 hypothetical protein TrVE_jg11630 [Triparma verrucosa]